jgi:hypothetical protein
LHRLSASFVLAYHGCDEDVAERVLKNQAFKSSNNDYDWLGEGVYFWEANPLRGLEFAVETSKRKGSKLRKPTVVGAVIDLGYCLDLMTSRGLQQVKTAYENLRRVSEEAGKSMPENQPDGVRHNLDCAVINYLHRLEAKEKKAPFDSVKGIFIETPDLYPGSAFGSKNHIQIAIRSLNCIKGVFRVPTEHLVG